MGGAGVLESLAYEVAEKPNLIFDALDAVISPSDLEQTDIALSKIVKLSVQDPEVQGLVKNLRRSSSLELRRRNYLEFSKKLNTSFSLYLSEAIAVSLNSRLLRQGANNSLDKIYFALLSLREVLEKKVGFVIPNREFAFVASIDIEINALVQDYLGTYVSAEVAGNISTISTLESLMWIRDFEVRREELKTYNPYRSDIFVDPIVVRNLQHKVQFKKVNYVDHKWQSAVISALHDNGSVDLVVAKQDVHKFQSELFMLLATPIDVDALQFYPSIDSVDSLGDNVAISVILREQIS